MPRPVLTGAENFAPTGILFFRSRFLCSLSVLCPGFCLLSLVYNTHTAQTSMQPVGFKLATPASDRPQPLALDRSATGIRSPDPPARSQSLYRLGHPDPYVIYETENKAFLVRDANHSVNFLILNWSLMELSCVTLFPDGTLLQAGSNNCASFRKWAHNAVT